MRTVKSSIEGTTKKYTLEEWHAEAAKRFGAEAGGWKFVCPSCGYVASVKEYRDAGAPAGGVAYSCIGRYLKGKAKDAFTKDGGPCNYAGGGLFRINPVTVVDLGGEEHYVFDFASPAESAPKRNTVKA